METIIALQGEADKGKTSTYILFRDLLLKPINGYTQISGKYEIDPSGKGNDFIDIFEKNGKRIGISSAGDLPDIITRKLAKLEAEGCNIICTACRTQHYVHGRRTVDAIEAFTSYICLYKLKKLDSLPVKEADSLSNLFNINDASTLYIILEQLIK